MTPQQKQQIIKAIATKNLKEAQQAGKVAKGQKVVLCTFLDCMMHCFVVDENGNECAPDTAIEVELAEPIQSFFERIEKEEIKKPFL